MQITPQNLEPKDLMSQKLQKDLVDKLQTHANAVKEFKVQQAAAKNNENILLLKIESLECEVTDLQTENEKLKQRVVALEIENAQLLKMRKTVDNEFESDERVNYVSRVLTDLIRENGKLRTMNVEFGVAFNIDLVEQNERLEQSLKLLTNLFHEKLASKKKREESLFNRYLQKLEAQIEIYEEEHELSEQALRRFVRIAKKNDETMKSLRKEIASLKKSLGIKERFIEKQKNELRKAEEEFKGKLMEKMRFKNKVISRLRKQTKKNVKKQKTVSREAFLPY